MSQMDALFKAALAVRLNAHAPYSEFLVGAAIRDEEGEIHVGCNVENVAYPEGTCAEAGAIAAMCAAGKSRKINAVCVIADSPTPITPCGGCRQKLAEFGNESVEVALADLNGIRSVVKLGALLPGSFSSEHMSLKVENDD